MCRSFCHSNKISPRTLEKYIFIKDNDNQLPYQNVYSEEAKQLFLKRVNKGIFEENEPETLKGLIDDYNDILTNHNFPIINRPATIKTMIPKKIDKTIDFHNRVHKYKSAIGYDISERRFIYRDSSKFLGDINQ